jgi:hypothetical protein
MGKNQLFIPGTQLDDWLQTSAVELQSEMLVVSETGDRFALEEAVLVVAEVSGAGDRRRLAGRVHTLPAARSFGGELLGKSLILNDAAYDVQPGFLASPVGTAGRARASEAVVAGLPSPTVSVASASDEDEALLAQYLMRKLE